LNFTGSPLALPNNVPRRGVQCEMRRGEKENTTLKNTKEEKLPKDPRNFSMIGEVEVRGKKIYFNQSNTTFNTRQLSRQKIS
jgi:hypothetical protein